ncbi:hypothetical protein SAMN05428982_1816 [Pseudoxanthomonas sp. CF385]|uniref:DUF6151 family protein n=1 Tax=Pseudoxanthomonas sp. CF385 TaxID=1881042 RepID=UPI000885F6E7|nr:DUF6151 family protein [Pseudoxanthomonas sp. CF385]SDQ61346.1 hypothetical protein SAMN05428982_1816 [Pseudoxanthomonas sp. CF385]
MTLALRCRCGQVKGIVVTDRAYVRATCYCRDCQAYARHLGQPGLMDAHGGTDIVAMNPLAVRFTAGEEHIAGLCLRKGGLYRWYAECCRTPLGNTPHDGRTAYVGMVTACLAPAAEVDASFGPAGRVVLNTDSALGDVSGTPVAFVLGGARIATGILGAKLRRQPPSLFFNPSGQTLRTAYPLSSGERDAVGLETG